MSPGCPFKTGEKVFCYHGPLLYEAKILSLRLEKDKTIKKLFLHYNGWSKKWDEWVSEDRVFQINDETIQKKRELESAQKKADRIKALKKSSSRIVGKKKVSQTQENAAQRNGLNPKSTLSTKRKRTSTCESDNKLENGDNESENLENEDYTKVWKGCQASKCKNEVLREPGVPFEPCPECNEKQIREAFRYKSMHKQVEHKATPHRDLIIWFKRLKDLGFEFTSIPNICNDNYFKMQQCPMCPYSSNRLPDLRRHMKIHSGKCPYTCNLCQRSFSRSENLRTHLLNHSAVKLYQCSFCNKGFTMMSSVRIHITAFHRKIRDENRATCTDHAATETLMKTPVMEADFKMHQCHMCPFSFNEWRDLRRHLFTHMGNRPHTCDLCQQSFACSETLRTHRHTHFSEKRYQCSICEKRFNRSDHLKIHQYSHLAEKRFQCSICEKGFNRSGHLKIHQYSHLAEKRYQCSICEKGFNRSDHLKIHQYSHLAEKPFQCSICNRRFTRMYSVQRHITVGCPSQYQ